MLIEFRVENFRSIREETGLSLLASSCTDHPSHVVEDTAGKPVSALRVAALYGANASGKSNLVRAMAFARKLIVDGTRGENPTGTEPFLMNDEWRRRPSRFEFVLKYDGRLYTYGFVVDARRVLEEWLFVVSNKREQKWFERVAQKGNEVGVEIGSALAGRSRKQRDMLDFVAMGTRPNQLLLTEMHERNVAAIKPLMRWFRDVLTIIRPDSVYSALELRVRKEPEFTEFLGRLLAAVDTGVTSLHAEAVELDFDQQFPDMPEDLKDLIRKAVVEREIVQVVSDPGNQFVVAEGDSGKPTLLRLRAVHAVDGEGTASFDFEQEADGTRRLANLAPILFALKSEERVYFVDELDRSMHPLLALALVRTFLAGTGGTRRSQLLFTTHETSLLDQDLLRRDEVWFVERDHAQASHLTSLWEYKVRPDASLQKWYLQGRFGAIPFIGDTSKLGLPPNTEE